jgi:hypothetical protein
MAGTPSYDDADMLLRVLELFLSEPVAAARQFMRTVPDGRTYDELRDEYPPGSLQHRHIDTYMVFWETAGSLLKHGLLNETLAFDTFLDAPPWPKMEAAIRSLRAERKNQLEGENIEYAYRRSQEWLTQRAEQRTGNSS